ncbi:fumarylacetoacetate hydrolase family protein [Aspergillus violaceofuscus CBS 115571]|uniref:Fumarylacetoacetate hydrolase family protein n=1 Tax=Aspergillus violaceofuscus (strain CBS 115571) TaxID=1450538 RepID=A0A2V5ICT1_ASPV1|nr:fumarylacetoacetate hydrolase family protein [Aspergillus violaceofuscus CBS 115571]
MANPKFQRLIRFLSTSGETHMGELPESHLWTQELVGTEVLIYEGKSPWDEHLRLTDQRAVVKEVLSPFPEVPFIYGVGLNYRKHAEESGDPIPTYPKTFVKYPDAMAGPFEDIYVHHSAKEVDYEGELVVVIGEDVCNLSEQADPMVYVLGYTIGNDVSSRWWQRATGGQSNYAKSFEGFAPLGPVLVSSTVVPNPGALTLRTWVNGEKRQESGIDDLIFDVGAIVRFFSQGRTLRKGSVIMTGTPYGVGTFIKGGPKFLKDGDEVKIEIDQIGHICNKFVFEP